MGQAGDHRGTKNLRPAPRLQARVVRRRVSNMEENSGRTRVKTGGGWIWESKARWKLLRTSFRTWWEAEASLQRHEEGVDGDGMEITDIDNLKKEGGPVSLGTNGVREGFLGQKVSEEVYSQ